jgi:uncharacterized repeat protein (TIGR03803 family)
MRHAGIAIAWISALLYSQPANAQVRFDIIHAFTGLLSPSGTYAPEAPFASIMQARDGSFLLTSPGGGIYRKGAVVRMYPDGTLVLLHSFRGDPDGAVPVGALVEASDGAFYGTTARGGAPGLGTVYKMTSDGTVTLLYAFTGIAPDGAMPLTALVEGSDGYLYGTTSRGSHGGGMIFKISTAGTGRVLTGLTSFNGPPGPLLLASDGQIYATTAGHGVLQVGYAEICRCIASRSVARPPVGQTFYGSLVETPTGIYALATRSFGATPERTIVNLTTGAIRNLPDGSNGPDPVGTLIGGADGNLYGTTARDGAFGRGTVFRMTPAGDVTIVSSFAAGRTADYPAPMLMQSSDGNFYGTTASAASPGPGAVFRMTPAGDVTFLAGFDDGSTGRFPAGPLVEGTDGYLYGTTSSGGSFGLGTVFRMTGSGAVSVLHHFTGGRGGASPRSSLVLASDGNFYGTTNLGGSGGFGTLFRMDTKGVVTILHEFLGGAQGAWPTAALVEGFDGNLYGTTTGGSTTEEGSAGRGTAFRITPGGLVSVLHVFGGGVGESANPLGPLVQLGDGTFVGMTTYGGSLGAGTVFSLTPGGRLTVLYSLNGFDGDYSWYPRGLGVTGGVDGNAYAVQRPSCKGAPGLLLRIAAGGSVAVVREFSCFEGPATLPLQAADGYFYAVSYEHRLFRWSPDGTPSELYRFKTDYSRSPDPYVEGLGLTQLVKASDGNFYGTTSSQGPLGGGTIFRLRVFAGAARTIAIDTPHDGEVRTQPFDVAGWAIDQSTASAGAGVDLVHVWAYPTSGSGTAPIFVGEAPIGGLRPDVGRIYGAQFSASGFGITVRGLPPGTYQLAVFAHSTDTGTFADVRAVTVTVGAAPLMSIDTPVTGSTVDGAFRIAGWAIDRAASTGTGVDTVHVWAYPNPGSGTAPRFMGVAVYGGARPDVGAAFGTAFTSSAFDLVVGDLTPGLYQLAVFARSSVSGTFSNVKTVTIQMLTGAAIVIDTPVEGATLGPVELRGWAIDRAAAQGTGVDTVHVWAYPNPGSGAAPLFVGVATYGLPRPDVGAVFGEAFSNSGFSLTITTPRYGMYQIVAFAHSTVTGSFTSHATRTVDVLAAETMGAGR